MNEEEKSSRCCKVLSSMFVQVLMILWRVQQRPLHINVSIWIHARLEHWRLNSRARCRYHLCASVKSIANLSWHQVRRVCVCVPLQATLLFLTTQLSALGMVIFISASWAVIPLFKLSSSGYKLKNPGQALRQCVMLTSPLTLYIFKSNMHLIAWLPGSECVLL